MDFFGFTCGGVGWWRRLVAWGTVSVCSYDTSHASMASMAMAGRARMEDVSSVFCYRYQSGYVLGN